MINGRTNSSFLTTVAKHSTETVQTDHRLLELWVFPVTLRSAFIVMSVSSASPGVKLSHTKLTVNTWTCCGVNGVAKLLISVHHLVISILDTLFDTNDLLFRHFQLSHNFSDSSVLLVNCLGNHAACFTCCNRASLCFGAFMF